MEKQQSATSNFELHSPSAAQFSLCFISNLSHRERSELLLSSLRARVKACTQYVHTQHHALCAYVVYAYKRARNTYMHYVHSLSIPIQSSVKKSISRVRRNNSVVTASAGAPISRRASRLSPFLNEQWATIWCWTPGCYAPRAVVRTLSMTLPRLWMNNERLSGVGNLVVKLFESS